MATKKNYKLDRCTELWRRLANTKKVLPTYNQVLDNSIESGILLPSKTLRKTTDARLRALRNTIKLFITDKK